MHVSTLIILTLIMKQKLGKVCYLLQIRIRKNRIKETYLKQEI